MKKNLMILFLLMAGLFSCTELDEEVYSTIINENFYKTEKQVLAAAGPAYSNLRAYPEPGNIWGVQEFPADEIVLPTRGIHWYNDGVFQRFHRHNWNVSEGHFNTAWNFIFGNINTCNRLLYQFGQIENKSEAILVIMEELKGLRAFSYFLGIDLFGNIPWVDKFDVPEGFAPANLPRKEIFDLTVAELESVIPQLSPEINISTYGRFHRWAAYATLAKLYLNAEVYTGQPMWDQAIEACDAIINSGNYSLAADFFANFAVNNESSPENIFVIPYDDKLPADWGRMFQLQYWTIHFNGHRKFNMQNGGWNGFAGTPSFVRSYEEGDVRARAWLTGPQYSSAGEVLYNNQEKSGEPLVYTVDITSLEAAFENEGARLVKYDYTGAENWTLSNDFVVFRYADILLMKAEALMRKNGGVATADALDLVNQVRVRAFPDDESKLYTLQTLTLEALLAERGWELAGEAWRRHDQIRFGDFTTGTWTFKESVTPAFRTIYPIPQAQINANPNLEQNPGY